MSNPPAPPGARPLSGFARAVLVITTTATIALFYFFITALGLALLLWLGMLLMVVLALARFGMAGLVMKYVERDFRLVGLMARSLWLSDGANYRLPLQRGDAPRLFAVVEQLAARLAIPPPDELCLEMSSGAWVELRGLKTGLGTTRVGVGYDLLAALTEREAEAVLAHELAHAKLITRVFRNWLSRGLSRAARVSNELAGMDSALRGANESVGPCALALGGADALTRLCARQVAAYSRQAEFEADRGAAELCGPAALRSALVRLGQVESVLGHLPWNERVARIESPDGLSNWLQQQLSGATADDDGPQVFDRYSTHPPLADRLAALPPHESQPADSPSALNLLGQPDALALRLVEAIERTAFQEESRDSRNLRKWLRDARRGEGHRLAQLPGGIIVLAAFVVGPAAMMSGFVVAGLLTIIILMALGIWLYRLGYYRDQRPLPVPDYAVFMKARQGFPLPNIEARQKDLETELLALIASEKKKKRQTARLVEEAYAALSRADYLRAHVASRLARDRHKNSIEGALAQIVAAAAFGQQEAVNSLMRFVISSQAGLRSPSTTWAFAWAFMLEFSWTPAEALLHETMKRRPDEPNLLAMLALCQGRRGKLQTAIVNGRRICEPKAPSEQHLQLFVGLLLDRGSLREAAQHLEKFGAASAYDPDVAYLRTRLALLQHDFAAAEKALAMIDLATLPSQHLLAIGQLYESARADTQAEKYYQDVLARGHAPEALLGRARLALKTRDKTRAREFVMSMLDSTKPAIDGVANAYDLFPTALAMLRHFETPADNCRAWFASVLPGKDAGPLTHRSLVIYARNEKEVETHLQNLLRALQPDKPILAAAYLRVEPAPRGMQPDRPVQPGVQYVHR